MRVILPLIAITVLLYTVCPNSAAGQDELSVRLQNVTQRVNELESKEKQLLQQRETGSAIVFLFGAFCALWAQNTNRNAWLWFFLGVLFNVITVIVLLYKNSKDRRTQFKWSPG